MRELIIQAAKNELGNSDPTKYWSDVWTYPGHHPKEWCGAFALWCLHQANIALDIDWTFNPPYYGFLYQLSKTESPLVGDILYINAPFEHHAVIESFDGEFIWSIDGNSPNVAQHVRPYNKNKLTCYSIAKWLPE